MSGLTENLLTFWADELCPLDVSQIETFSLADATKEFLGAVGLPVGNKPLSNKIKEISLLEFCANLKDTNYLLFRGQQYLALARNVDGFDDFLAVAESSDQIFYLQDLHETSSNISFVNSSIELHLSFWQLVFQEYLLQTAPVSEEDRAKIVEILRARFTTLDEMAIRDEYSFWSAILVQIEDQLL